uniref:PQQ-binding-like beta-propeller repeat protein n=1 Tax=Streptomyces gossypiisoli TaxID=2748864 RepID=UPI0015DA35EE
MSSGSSGRCGNWSATARSGTTGPWTGVASPPCEPLTRPRRRRSPRQPYAGQGSNGVPDSVPVAWARCISPPPAHLGRRRAAGGRCAGGRGPPDPGTRRGRRRGWLTLARSSSATATWAPDVTPVVADGTVYVGCYDDHLYALDAATGAAAAASTSRPPRASRRSMSPAEGRAPRPAT